MSVILLFMKMKALITADDFGFSSNINKAIIDVYTKHRITELSLMVDAYGTDEAVSLIKTHNIKNVGLHFSLCRVSRDGAMIKGKQYDEALSTWSSDQFIHAFDEEVDLFISKVGFAPSHIIGHKQIALHPKIVNHIADYCKKRNCYIRARVEHKTLTNTPLPPGILTGRIVDKILGFRYGSPSDMYTQYKNDIDTSRKDGAHSIEIFFHPGYAGEYEKSLTSFIQERIDDIHFLLSDEFMKLVEEEDLELVPSSRI